jgi:hypothetical protein
MAAAGLCAGRPARRRRWSLVRPSMPRLRQALQPCPRDGGRLMPEGQGVGGAGRVGEAHRDGSMRAAAANHGPSLPVNPTFVNRSYRK